MRASVRNAAADARVRSWAALRRGEGVNVHQRLVSAAKSGKKDQGADSRRASKGAGRGGGNGARTLPKESGEMSFLDSLNSY